MAELSVCTYNVRHRRENPQIKNDIFKLIDHGAEVICLQEMGGHEGALQNLPHLWNYYMPSAAGNDGGRSDTPILYKIDKLKFHAADSRHVSPPTTVEEGSGGSTIPEKTITVVRCHHRQTDASIVFMNTHALPTIDDNGHPHNPRRMKLFGMLMDTMQTMVRNHNKEGSLSIFCGDLNVDFENDRRVGDHDFPYYKMNQVDMRSSFQHLGSLPGSEGNRLIDYVCHSVDKRITPIEQVRIENTGGDHSPILVKYQIDKG